MGPFLFAFSFYFNFFFFCFPSLFFCLFSFPSGEPAEHPFLVFYFFLFALSHFVFLLLSPGLDLLVPLAEGEGSPTSAAQRTGISLPFLFSPATPPPPPRPFPFFLSTITDLLGTGFLVCFILLLSFATFVSWFWCYKRMMDTI